jgi:hypothetical protein
MRKPKTDNQTEHHIKQQVRKILKDTGWKFWMPSANAFGRGGQSDFLAVKNYQLFMAIETKYKDIPTQLQLEFLKMIHEAGHYAFLVDETNVDELQEFLAGELNPYQAETTLNNLRKWQENLTNTQQTDTLINRK